MESQFDIDPGNWLHRELATPLGFQKWTNRPNGIVGGLGQNPDLFGPLDYQAEPLLKGYGYVVTLFILERALPV